MLEQPIRHFVEYEADVLEADLLADDIAGQGRKALVDRAHDARQQSAVADPRVENADRGRARIDMPSSIATRCVTTHFSLQVLTNSRYFCRLSKKRKTGSPVASGTVFVTTSAVFTADPRGSRFNEAFDQPIDFARLFHMREVPRLLEDMNGQASRQRFGV